MKKNGFAKRESVMKWNRILGSLAIGAMFWACSDNEGKDVAGGASGDAGVVAVKDLDVAGLAQKGPFVNGSEVTVQGIDCKTMEFTEEEFTGTVKSNKGDFSIEDVSLKSSCALFEVTGIYRSEITGKKSSKELTLRALTDLKDRKSVNINILTNLEYERIMYLVTEKKMTFAKAKEQAEKDVLAAFDIAGSFEEFENLNIFEAGDENAALLAVSVMMQAETDDAGLAKRMEKFADSFAETGKWKDSDTKTAISEWAVEATANGMLDSVRKNVEAWNDGDKVAAFEKFIGAYADGDSVVLNSSAEASADSEYDASANTLKDLRDGKVYRTVTIGDQIWMAENLNFAYTGVPYKYVEYDKEYTSDSTSWCYGNNPANCAKYGRLYTWSAAMDSVGVWSKNGKGCGYDTQCSPIYPVQGICPDGWHLPEETEWETLWTAVGGKTTVAKMLKSTSGWEEDGNGIDAYTFSALPAGSRYGNGDFFWEGDDAHFWSSTGSISDGAYDMSLYYNYDNANLNIDSKSAGYSVRCLKDASPAIVSSSSSSSGVTPKSSDSETSVSSSSVPEGYVDPSTVVSGTMTDDRDGQTYKTVKIGDQVWMAENLSYAYTGIPYKYVEYDKEYASDSTSWFAAYDPKYGRLYTWATAMDSAGRFTTNGKGCGYGKTCSPTYPVRGVCPEGWHLPMQEEWDTLFAAVGGRLTAGKVLKSQTDWSEKGMGSDDYSFAALPAGCRNELGSFIDYVGAYLGSAFFWSSSEHYSKYAYSIHLHHEYDSAYLHNDFFKDYGMAVRCVKD